jgi:nitrate/nitrite-specific signal transduction histidine kinase
MSIQTSSGEANQSKRNRRCRINTIRARLLVGFVLIALLPAVAISVGSTIVGYRNGRQQALERLESVVALRELEINTWIGSMRNELTLALTEEYALDRARVVLGRTGGNQYYEFFNKALRYRLDWFVGNSEQLKELFLIDRERQVVLSTDVAQEGRMYVEPGFPEQGSTNPRVWLPFYARPEDPMSAVVMIPVAGADGSMLGVMAGRASVEALGDILSSRGGLGRTGKAYLVDPNYCLLAESNLRSISRLSTDERCRKVHSAGTDTAMKTRTGGSGTYNDYRGIRVVGAHVWLPELGMALMAEQDLSEISRAIYAGLGVNVSVAMVSVLLAVGASLFITHSIASPLVNLVETATRIAGGDLGRVAVAQGEDEVAVLARAFNSMTAQLRNLISSLEQRVAERTEALQRANQSLQHRAVQLETSAQVSREITSILNIDDLLRQVVDLIRDAFGYYHVYIFLVGEQPDRLEVRASSGGITPMLRPLKIGPGSLNGAAAYANEAVLANDVSQDSRYLADELLPDTQSELVIPLRFANRVLGTLDVQSSLINAFAASDVLVLQSLGDQIAIAIENAYLYDRSRELATLEERHRLARELHDSVTQSLFSLDLHAKAVTTYLKRDPQQAEVHAAELRQITHDTLGEMRSLIFDLRPPSLKDNGLISALRQQIERLRRPDGPELVLQAAGDHRLPGVVEQELFRIAQEALSNAMKHAGAKRIVVELTIGSEQVALCVTDDGRGFDPESLPTHRRAFGLTGMRERAELLRGRFDILSRPGVGTKIEVCVPT